MELSPDFPLLLAAARAREGLNLAIKFDPNLHPRDPKGQWRKVFNVVTGAGANRTEHRIEASDWGEAARQVPGGLGGEVRQIPLDVGDDVEWAAELLAQGHKVELDTPRTVSTLLDKLREQVQEAEKLGDKAPNWDLCGVTVKGTNLFCVESKGIERIKMPQLKGVPEAGSPADSMKKDDKGKVDLSDQFVEFLEGQDISVDRDTERASYLKATQSELNGAKVAGMAGAIRAGKSLGDEPLFVSMDDYIVDGHHRWAAHVGVDTLDDELGDIDMSIYRIDADIIDILAMANKFALEQGIPQAGF